MGGRVRPGRRTTQRSRRLQEMNSPHARLTRTQFVIAGSVATRQSRRLDDVSSADGIAALRSQWQGEGRSR